MRYAVIEGGIVVNVAEADLFWVEAMEAAGKTVVPDLDAVASIGDTYADGVFTRPGA